MKPITLKDFDSLSKRDFDNGAVIHQIRLALQEREGQIGTEDELALIENLADNDELIEKAEIAIDDLFGDMSVSKEVGIQNLDKIRGQISNLILVLEEDLFSDNLLKGEKE